MSFLDIFKRKPKNEQKQADEDVRQTQLSESFDEHLLQLESGAARIVDYGFRRLVGNWGDELLNPLGVERSYRIMKYLYFNKPLAKRLVSIPVDFCHSVEIIAEEGTHPMLQQILDEFWKDEYNDLQNMIGRYFEWRQLFGELLLPVEVNPQNGRVKVMFDNSENIKTIYALENDMRWIDKIEMKAPPGEKPKTYKVIRYIDDPKAKTVIGSPELGNLKESPIYKLRYGNAFYFADNRLVVGRGRPDLEPIVDWIDVHDHIIFDQARNINFQSFFLLQEINRGYNENQLRARQEELAKKGIPKPGSYYVTNENRTLEAISPKVQASVYIDLATAVRKICALGAGLSETWVLAADDINRATSVVADSPALRHLERKRAEFERMVRFMCDFAIDMAILHGRLNIDPSDYSSRAFLVKAPDLVTSDNKAVADALNSLSSALIQALAHGICDKNTARTIWFSTAGIGMPNNLEQAIAKDQREDAEAPYKDIEDLLRQFERERSPTEDDEEN